MASPNFKCPVCGRPARFEEEPLGPFCTRRCKLVDLGAWMSEGYRITEPLRPEHFEGAEADEEDL